MAQQVTDTFVRANNSSSWGVASDGINTWSKTGTGTSSIASNEGVIVSSSSDTHMQAGVLTSANANVLVRFAINNANDIAGVEGRYTAGGSTSAYKVLWYSGALHINKAVSGTLTANLVTAATFAVTIGSFYWLRISVTGTTITGKIWADGNAEPNSPTLTATDSTVTGSGGYALVANTDPSSSGVKFDSLNVTDNVALSSQKAADTFVRANSGSWGTASDGTTVWSVNGGGTASVASNEGLIVSSGVDMNMQAGASTSNDCDVRARVIISNTGDIAFIEGRYSVVASVVATYKAIWTGGNFQIKYRASGTSTALVTTAYTMTVGSIYWIRLQCVGTTLNAKIWLASGAEPSTWTLTTTHTSLTTGGYALGANTNSGGTGVQFDSFLATDNSSSGVVTTTYASTEQISSAQADATATISLASGVTTTSYFSTEQITSASADATVSIVSTAGTGGGGGGTITAGDLPGFSKYGGVSSGIFGTNLANYISDNQSIVGNTSVQQKIKSMGITVIRCSLTDSNGNIYSNSQLDAIYTAITNCGAVMFGILNSTLLVANKSLVSYLGNRCLIYEYGNERDINGMSVQTYSSNWNTYIPQYRALNPNAKFGGPTLGVFSNLNSYLVPWLHSAHAAGVNPDFVSIHNYPDYSGDPKNPHIGTPSAQQALQDAFNIGKSCQTTQNAIVAEYGHTIPICMTEWNVDAQFAQPYRDDPVFAAQFLKNVITSLVQANVTMANQFEINLDYVSPGSYYQPMKDAIKQYLVGTAGGGGGTGTPSITLSPPSLSYTGQTGAASPSSQNTVIRNAGNAVGNWTVAGVPTWLSLNATTGAIQAGGLQNVLLTASQAGLAVGTYNATLTYTMGTTTATQTISLVVTAATVTFSGITPLSAFLSNAASAQNSAANQLYSSTGASGSPATNATYTLIGTNTGWGEITSQGTQAAWASGSSIGLPSGLGFFLDATFLQGNSLVAGAYNGNIRLNAWANSSQSGTIQADIVVRAYKWNGGTYTPIASLTLLNQTVPAAFTTFPLPSISTSNTTPFVVGDYLYFDIQARIITNGNGQASQAFRLNRLSTDTTTFIGDSNAMVVTPGYSNGTPVLVIEQLLTASADATVSIVDLGQLYTSVEQLLTARADATVSIVSNLPTTPGVTIQIAGVTVPIKENSFTLRDTLSSASTCHFIVEDLTGLSMFTRSIKVQVYDFLNGKQYTGVVMTVDRENFRPQVLIESTIASKDNHYFAEKRTYSGPEYTNIEAGVIAADMVQSLAAEGITAPIASKRETTQADFAKGVLTGVVATANVGKGSLELTPAGTSISVTEKNTTDWLASGSVLTGTYYGNNLLTLFPNNALKLQGTSSQGGNNNFTYLKIWAGGQVISAGDVLTYFVWISSTSPAIMAGIDGVCTDGSTIRDNINLIDQNGLQAHPKTDLSGYANDQRYKRTIDLSLLAGKTLAYITVVLEGDAAGQYTAFFDTVQLIGSGNNIKQNFYTTSLQTVVQLQNIGYSGVMLSQVKTYTNPGNRVSPAFSLTSAGIAGSSQVNWVEELLTTPSVTPELGGAVGANSVAYVQVETSIDNQATWQICTNHAPIPGLLPGQNLTGLNLYFRQTINVAGPDPTITPALQLCNFTLTPSYASAKNDAILSASSLTTGFAGTLTGVTVQSAGDLTLASTLRNYSKGDSSGHSIIGSGVPYGGIITSSFQIGCTSSGSDVRARLDFAGSWSAPFTMEVDLYINSFGDYGVVYLASGWANTNNATNGYTAMVNLTNIYLGYTNGGTFYQLANVGGLSLSAGVWHRLKVVINGSNHRIYLDDVLYINVSDSHYTSGQFGYRYYNTSGVQHSGFFNNFGVVASLQGTWISQGLSLGSVGVVGNSIIQWNNVPLPANCTLTISASIDNTTWYLCTNGAALPMPQVAAGQNVSAVSVYVRAVLLAFNSNVTPDLLGLSVTVIGAYSSSGVRVGPLLDLSTVTGTLGDDTVGWNANLPTGTTLGIDTAVDGGAWQNITGQTGYDIPGLLAQPAPIIDSFTSALSYSNTFGNGGAIATWAGDYSNGRILATGGTKALYINFATKSIDTDLFVDMDQSDAGGLVWGYVDANNYYECVIGDASSSVSVNTIGVYKMLAGIRTLLTAGAIAFTRGTYKRFRVIMLTGVISVSIDGINVLNYTDGTPLVGSAGLRNDTGISRYYQLRVQPLGQKCAGHTVQMRQRLASTNPQATPQVLNTILCAFGTTIQAGAIIPQTVYNQNYYSSNFDDLVKQCSASGGQWYWYIDKNKVFYLQPQNGIPAPWIASDNPGDFLNSGVGVSDQSDLYRNRSIIKNVLATTGINENRYGDGASKSWTFGNSWASVPTILVNNVPATVGVKNVDTGKQFYYAIGDNTITQDSGGTVYDATYLLNFSGIGQYSTYSQYDNLIEQAALKALEGGTGIVEVVEDGTGLTKLQGDALAIARVTQYGVRGQVLTASTRRYGLAPGMLLPVFLPTLGVIDTAFLIRSITTTLQTEYSPAQGAMIQQGVYQIEGITGPDLLGWEQLYKR